MNSASPPATDRVKLFALGRHPCSTHLYTNSISIWKADSLLLRICQNINISVNSPVGEALAWSLWWLLPCRKSDQALLMSPTCTLGVELNTNSFKLRWQWRTPGNNGLSLYLWHCCRHSRCGSRSVAKWQSNAALFTCENHVGDRTRPVFICLLTWGTVF